MALTRNSSGEKVFHTQFDTENTAIVGAISGFFVGSAYELSEVFFNSPHEIETFLQIIAEVGAATLGGSLMFVVFSTIRNRLKQDLRGSSKYRYGNR
jgi:hypothetical protein